MDVWQARGIKYLNVQTWLLFATPLKISDYAPVIVAGQFFEDCIFVEHLSLLIVKQDVEILTEHQNNNKSAS